MTSMVANWFHVYTVSFFRCQLVWLSF